MSARPSITAVQRRALMRLSPREWRGNLEAGVGGGTLPALERKGLVRTAVVKRPHRRIVARLTDAGVRLTRDLELDELERRWRAGAEERRPASAVRLWIAGRISRADLDESLDVAAAVANTEERARAVERLALDVLERLGAHGATLRELAGLLEGEGLVVDGLVELDAALERIGRHVVRRTVDGRPLIFARLYPISL